MPISCYIIYDQRRRPTVCFPGRGVIGPACSVRLIGCSTIKPRTPVFFTLEQVFQMMKSNLLKRYKPLRRLQKRLEALITPDKRIDCIVAGAIDIKPIIKECRYRTHKVDIAGFYIDSLSPWVRRRAENIYLENNVCKNAEDGQAYFFSFVNAIVFGGGLLQYVFEDELEKVEQAFQKMEFLDKSLRLFSGHDLISQAYDLVDHYLSNPWDRHLSSSRSSALSRLLSSAEWVSDSLTPLFYGESNAFIDFYTIIAEINDFLKCNWIDQVFQYAYERREYPLEIIEPSRGNPLKNGEYRFIVDEDGEPAPLDNYLWASQKQNPFAFFAKSHWRAKICRRPIFWFSGIKNIAQAAVTAIDIFCDDAAKNNQMTHPKRPVQFLFEEAMLGSGFYAANNIKEIYSKPADLLEAACASVMQIFADEELEWLPPAIIESRALAGDHEASDSRGRNDTEIEADSVPINDDAPQKPHEPTKREIEGKMAYEMRLNGHTWDDIVTKIKDTLGGEIVSVDTARNRAKEYQEKNFPESPLPKGRSGRRPSE